MAEFDLTKQLEEAAKERSNIAKSLLAIQQSLDKLAPTVLKMEPVLASLEPAVNNLSAWCPRVDAAVGQLQNDPSDTRKQLEKITLAPFGASKASDPSSSTAVDAPLPASTVLDVDQVAVNVDVLGRTTMAPATCSMQVPDHNTGDEDPGVMSLLSGSTPATLISPLEDSPSPSLEPLVAFELTTLPPTTCSAECPSSIIGSPSSASRITHATPTWLLPAPASMLGPELRLQVWTSPSTPHVLSEVSVVKPFKLFVNCIPQKSARKRCLSICFGLDVDMLMPDVHPTIEQQGRVLRPAPWPSFVCSHVCTVLQLDEFRSLAKISSTGMPMQHSVGFLTGDELVLGCPVQPQSISFWEYLQYELLHTWTNARKEALREEKMLDFMVALMGLKSWLPWDCFSLEANFRLPHVTTRVLHVTSQWGPGVHKNLMTNHMGWLEPEMVTLMTIAKGEFSSRCVQIHPNNHAQLNFAWSTCYLLLQVGKLQNIMVELKTWPSRGWFLSAVTLSLNLHDIVCCNKALPLVDQVLWRILEYWSLDIQGLPLADAFFEDSFWPEQHIIEACLASRDHRSMVTNAVEWLYNHHSYEQRIEVGNQRNGKGRVPWLVDEIVVTTPGYPFQAKKIPYPCIEIVTTRLFGSDGIKCLEVLSNILQCTGNYLPVIMFDEIEPQLTIHWKDFEVQGKAMVVSNITKPTMVGSLVNEIYWVEYLVCQNHSFSSTPEVTLCESKRLEFNNWVSYMVEQYIDVSSYRMKTGLRPLYVSISMAEGTSHRNSSIHQLVEQQLSFPASTCTQSHIQAAIGENQRVYSLCCNLSCDLPNTIATWVEYPDRKGAYPFGQIIMDHHSRFGFLNLGVLLTWTHVSMVQITVLPCTELSSQKHPMPSVEQLMLKRSYRCLVRANTSPRIMLECSATELIAWVLGYVRTIAAYSSQCAFFTRLNGWHVMGQPSVLAETSLVGKQNLKESGVSCLWPSSSIKYAPATSTTSASTKTPTMTTTSTTSESLTSFKSTSTRATFVKATTTNLAAPLDPGKILRRRLGVKPCFKEGGMSWEQLHQALQKPKDYPLGPSRGRSPTHRKQEMTGPITEDICVSLLPGEASTDH
jgi:hypothetical protein